MADTTRRIVLDLLARNRAKGEMLSFSRGMDSIGNTMHRVAMGALSLAGIGGFGYLAKSMVSAASSAEETQAKFDTVFRDLSSEANTWSESFGHSVGRAEQDVKSWMAGLQDTFVPLGIARMEAMGLSQSLVQLAVDVASFNNKADADVIRDFTSALVGNHETVRKYGIIISETAIKQEAIRQGMNKTYKELTDLEKVQLRYNLIVNGTKDAQGDALRTSDSYANQVKRLSANWKDLSTTIGQDAIPALSSILVHLNKNVIKIREWHDELKEAIEEQKNMTFPFMAPPEQFWDLQGRIEGKYQNPVLSDQLADKAWAMKEFAKQVMVIKEGSAEQQAAMAEHYEKMLTMGGTYREMNERMAAQAWQTRVDAIAMAAEAEEQAAEEAAAKEREIISARADAYRDVYSRMGRTSQRVYDAQRQSLAGLYDDYIKLGLAVEDLNVWLEEEQRILSIDYLKTSGGIAGGFAAAGMQIKNEIDSWGERAFRFSMTLERSIARGLENTMRDFDNWKDHLLNIFEEVYWSAVRIAFIQPLAQGLASGFTGALGAAFPSTGGQTFDNPQAVYGAPPEHMQHGGVLTSPTMVMAGEVPEAFVPLSGGRSIPVEVRGGGSGGAVVIEHRLINQGQTKMEISSVEEYIVSDRRIVEVTMREMQTNLKFQKAVKQASR